MPERHSTKERFCGYPDWLTADWCCVTLQAARHCKSGIRAPGPAATKLFMLHRDGRILTSELEGWGLLEGVLCDPESHELTQAPLRAYRFVYGIALQRRSGGHGPKSSSNPAPNHPDGGGHHGPEATAACGARCDSVGAQRPSIRKRTLPNQRNPLTERAFSAIKNGLEIHIMRTVGFSAPTHQQRVRRPEATIAGPESRRFAAQ